jgi:NAD(P)-dependent dehydrogenase (short-subunit alcohol dehydrogenase family)
MKKVLITGGNKGIGLATTKKFFARGFKVLIVGRDFSKLRIKSRDVKKIRFDLTNHTEIPKLAKKVGDIDILVNNAGMMHALPFDSYPEEKVEKILSVNIKSPVALIREFSKGMIKKGRGRIVNVASIAGEIGHPDVWYGITKASIINITKSFAKALGKKGIVVNAVAPGPVETDLLKTIPEARKKELKKASILGRFAKPEEVAETIYWLATDCPEYINGICIDINNGAFPR